MNCAGANMMLVYRSHRFVKLKPATVVVTLYADIVALFVDIVALYIDIVTLDIDIVAYNAVRKVI